MIMKEISREFIIEVDSRVKKTIKKSRYAHTQGVRFTSAAMAMKHGVNIRSAELAGVLHDCAKNLSHKEMEALCKRHNVEISEAEKKNKELLHAKAGMCLSAEVYEIDDPDILNAVKYHTTGRPDMSDLEKIVFIADFIEPGRDKAHCLTEARKLAFEDLNKCMYIILKNTLEYLDITGAMVDDITKDALNYYKQYSN